MLGYPIINHRDGKYLVCDGQHRIYALKQNGFGDDSLDCEVYENLTDEEMAQMFLGRDRRKAISPFVKFGIACTAGYLRENAIKQTVEATGLKVSRANADNCVSAVSALVKIYDMSPHKDAAVGWCLRVAKMSFCGDPRAFDAPLLEALGGIYNRYNGKTVENILVAQLSHVPQGVRFVLRRAEALKEKTGNQKTGCIASVMVDLYNKGVTGRARLAPWFKEHATAKKVA